VSGRHRSDQLNVKYRLIRELRLERQGLSEGWPIASGPCASGQERSMQRQLFWQSVCSGNQWKAIQ
jgi:hypothetical protein